MRHFKHLAHLVKKKRLAHPEQYSQTQLSFKLGYKNGQFISNVERALCHLPFKILPQVCEVLNIAPEELKEAMLKDYEATISYYLKIPSQNDHLDIAAAAIIAEKSNDDLSPSTH